MKSNLTSLCLVAVFAFAAAPPLAAAEPSFTPKTFTAYIGGNNGPTYLVELHGGVLTYTDGPRNEPSHARITPTAAQWQEFRQSLDAIGIWRWRPDYTDKAIRDGTQWRISIEYADHTLKAGGSNDFPKDFDRYRTAVQKLLGGKTFK